MEFQQTFYFIFSTVDATSNGCNLCVEVEGVPCRLRWENVFKLAVKDYSKNLNRTLKPMLNANKQSIKCDSVWQTRWCLRTRKRHLENLKRRKTLETTHLKREYSTSDVKHWNVGSPSRRSRIVYDIIYGSGEEKKLCKALKRIFYSHTKRKIIQSALAGEKREYATSDTLVGRLCVFVEK